jgi:hypothetical protein
MSGVPYTFASATSSIPLSELDTNFATPVTIGTTSVTLGNTVTTLANVALANVTISSVTSGIPNNFLANSSVTIGNTSVALGSTVTSLGNVTLTNVTIQGGTSNVSTNSIVNGTSNVAIASANGAVTMVTNGNTAVTIDTSQNVGLGVTPSAWSLGKAVEVGFVGNAMWGVTAAQNVITQNTYYNSGYKYASTQAASYYQQQAGVHAWYNAPSGTVGNAATFTQAMTLDNSGYLNVGTTGNTFHTLQVNSSNNTAVQIKNASATNGYSLDIVSASSAASGNTWSLIRGFASSSSQVFAVLGNGNVQNANNSYGAISDVKLKENIVDATPKLADLLKVQIRNYNLKSDPTVKQLGVVAQELEQVFPSMIEESSDKDAEGNDLGTTTKSVKYSVFVPMLIKAIQELSAKVTALETKIGA